MNRTKLSFSEQVSFGLYSFGTILSYYLIMSYLQLYMTDIGIAAEAIGVVFIFAKVWDAVNDPVFGVMVDKIHFKKGKYLPWLRVATVAIPIATILLFIVPANASVQVKIIWSAVAYVLWDTSYTLCDVPLNSLATVVTEDLAERNRLYATAAFFVYLGGILVAVLVPFMYPALGWGTTAIILSVLSMLSMIPLHFKAKEQNPGETVQEEVSIGDILKSLFQNKYLLIFTGASIVGSITNFASTLNGYFAIHCLGSESWMMPLALASAGPVLFVSLLVPKLLAKMDKFIAYVVTRVITICIDGLIYFIGYENPAVLITLIVVKNVFAAVWGVTAVMFIADCVEYGQFRLNQRNQGIVFATKAFTNKIIVALTGSVAMFGLAAYGFQEGKGAIQSAATVQGIWNLYALWPIFGSIGAVILLVCFYKLRDHDVKLMIAANNGEISKAEAEKQFNKKI